MPAGNGPYLPDDLRYSDIRIKAAINTAGILKDDRITPAVVLAAYDFGVTPERFADMLDAFTTGIVKVADYKRRVRQEALRTLTQESQDIKGGYR